MTWDKKDWLTKVFPGWQLYLPLTQNLVFKFKMIIGTQQALQVYKMFLLRNEQFHSMDIMTVPPVLCLKYG